MRTDHKYLAPGNITVILTAVDVAGNEGHTSVNILVGLGDGGDEQFPYTTVLGILLVAVVVGATTFLLWFRRKKRQTQ